VLGVDEGGDAAQVLSLGDDVQGERGLAGRLRPVDLDVRPRGSPPIPSATSSDSAPGG
jgi:hypothetical protein